MTTVYYKNNNEDHVFYLKNEGTEYYLFTQKRRKGVGEFYRGNVALDRAICHGIGRRDTAIHKTMDKIVMQIRYIEKENDIKVLKKHKRKQRRLLC